MEILIKNRKYFICKVNSIYITNRNDGEKYLLAVANKINGNEFLMLDFGTEYIFKLMQKTLGYNNTYLFFNNLEDVIKFTNALSNQYFKNSKFEIENLVFE